MCYLAGDEEPLIRLKVALKASKGIIGGAVVMIPMVIIAGGLSRDGVAGFMARGWGSDGLRVGVLRGAGTAQE